MQVEGRENRWRDGVISEPWLGNRGRDQMDRYPWGIYSSRTYFGFLQRKIYDYNGHFQLEKWRDRHSLFFLYGGRMADPFDIHIDKNLINVNINAIQMASMYLPSAQHFGSHSLSRV
jgi:hypothetical protein